MYDPNPKTDGENTSSSRWPHWRWRRQIDWRPDIVHANDWHTAPAVYAVRLMQQDPFWKGVKTVFSVHNLGYMGAEKPKMRCWPYGLPPVEEPLLARMGARQPMGQGTVGGR